MRGENMRDYQKDLDSIAAWKGELKEILLYYINKLTATEAELTRAKAEAAVMREELQRFKYVNKRAEKALSSATAGQDLLDQRTADKERIAELTGKLEYIIKYKDMGEAELMETVIEDTRSVLRVKP
jgi:hypothetical protein